MNYFNQLKSEFMVVYDIFNQSKGMQKIINGTITLDHYIALMTQISLHARENPQLQVLAAVYFRGYQRAAIKMFFKHATSEIGHDQLALNDVAACGIDTTLIPHQNPLPETTALISFGFYQVQHLNPIGYLGYLFFLEFMPTQGGQQYLEALKKIGVPDNALSFVQDHTTIDMGHNKLMENYVNVLIRDQQQFDSVVYAMRVTGELYAKMIEGAFENTDCPADYGLSGEGAISKIENNLSQHQYV